VCGSANASAGSAAGPAVGRRLALLVKHLRLQKIKDNWGLASNFIVWQLLQACLVCCFVGVISGLIATMAATAAQEALSSSSQTVNDGDARPAADSCLLQSLFISAGLLSAMELTL
jgi:hypothetical protein